ncbi:MAG: TonB family protein [Opitutia bacterium]
MRPRRRHLLIWSAVTAAHLAAWAAVWSGAIGGPGEVRPPDGGLLLVVLTPEAPVALPGEVPLGDGLGGGALPPLPAPPTFTAPSIGPAPATALLPAAEAAKPLAPALSVVAAPGPAPAPVAFVPPAFLERVEPAYPPPARRAGAEGVATVRVRLDPAGTIVAVELAVPSGSRLLDEAALAAARASRFVPATRGQVRVSSEALATYRFELR